MHQIVDSAGNPIERSDRGDTLSRTKSQLKAWGIFFLSVIGTATIVIGNLKTIREALFGDPKERPAVMSEMTKAELAKMPSYFKFSPSRMPAKISGLIFHNDKKILDIRLKNATDQTVIINKIGIILSYQYNHGGKLPPTDKIDLGISPSGIRRAKAANKPFEFRKGYNVPWVIEPGKVEIYHFDMNITADDLLAPSDAPEGSFYKLSVYLNVDEGDELSGDVSADGYEIEVSDGQLYILMHP